MLVVPAFDELKNLKFCFCTSFKPYSLQKLAFKCRKERIAHHIVEAITHTSHRGSNSGFFATQSKTDPRDIYSHGRFLRRQYVL